MANFDKMYFHQMNAEQVIAWLNHQGLALTDDFKEYVYMCCFSTSFCFSY